MSSAVASDAGAGSPRFLGSSGKVDPKTRQRMTGVSWHRGCPIPLGRLRLLKVSHRGFHGDVNRGRLVVNADAARGMLQVMRALFRERYPIRRMCLVDAYGAVDRRSMRADNTSAFNCRFISGQPGVWSEHAFGRAIDVNPIENPYVYSSGYVSPPVGAPYAGRDRQRPAECSIGAVTWSEHPPGSGGGGAEAGSGPGTISTSRPAVIEKSLTDHPPSG